MLGMNLAAWLCVYYSRVAFIFRDMASTTSTISSLQLFNSDCYTVTYDYIFRASGLL